MNALWKTRLGKPTIFTRSQVSALIRADIWLALGYTFEAPSDDEPTYSDDLIAAMIRNHPRMALICKPSYQPKGPDFPFRVISAAHTERNAWCRSFRAAAEWISAIHQCDILLMPTSDVQPEYYEQAEQRRISLLAVSDIADRMNAIIDDCEYH